VGVPYAANAETNFQALPKPGEFILKDSAQWRDVIKRPEAAPADSFDWEKLAEDGAARVNRETTGVICMLSGGSFLTIIRLV
jgi:hypothetical protein